jgi:SAM-dependent methyltransferase
MPFLIDDINYAQKELNTFRSRTFDIKDRSIHERFIFPFLCGSYFTYRKVDVERITSIAKAISKDPTYLDVGCGYGDFLEKIIQYLPNAEGIEKSADIFFKLGRYKPDYIKIGDAYNGIEKKYDLIFVGWMEPGVDYRDKIASSTDVIITTFDKGGQCGMNGECEMDEYGFEKIASWITPSWIDVNTELLNKYYSKISNKTIESLKQLRGAHNLWYVYSKPKYKDIIKETLIKCLKDEGQREIHAYEFEKVLDDVGYGYLESIKTIDKDYQLWNIDFGS